MHDVSLPNFNWRRQSITCIAYSQPTKTQRRPADARRQQPTDARRQPINGQPHAADKSAPSAQPTDAQRQPISACRQPTNARLKNRPMRDVTRQMRAISKLGLQLFFARL
jgi:hypothetical protein